MTGCKQFFVKLTVAQGYGSLSLNYAFARVKAVMFLMPALLSVFVASFRVEPEVATSSIRIIWFNVFGLADLLQMLRS